MEIKYLGHASFRIRGKNAKVVIDPFNPAMVGLKFPATDADVVLITHGHSDHNNAKAVSGSPVILAGPGEYEVKGVKIYGHPSYHDKEKGAKRGKNTMYRMSVDGIHILHVGDLGEKLNDAALDELDGVDILMVPVGGTFTVDAKEALEVVRQIEPKIVIPMHYRVSGMSASMQVLQPLADFAAVMGKSVEPLPKLVITADKLPEQLTLVTLI